MGFHESREIRVEVLCKGVGQGAQLEPSFQGGVGDTGMQGNGFHDVFLVELQVECRQGVFFTACRVYRVVKIYLPAQVVKIIPVEVNIDLG